MAPRSPRPLLTLLVLVVASLGATSGTSSPGLRGSGDDDPPRPEHAPPAAEPALDPLARVAVLGASVSAGFQLAAELGADVDLADVLACMLPGAASDEGGEADEGPEVAEPAGPKVSSWSSTMLFVDPVGRGSELVEELRATEPTLVVALDFPFWFGYGVVPGGAEARLDRLALGLSLLERLACPLVVGDFPDVSRALEGEGLLGPMIHPSQIPAPEELAALNHALRAWAEERGAVVVSLAEALEAFAAGRPLDVRGNRLGGPPLSRWLQPDLLHPTVDGTIALGLLALDRLVAGRPELAQRGFVWSLERVRGRLEEATAAERAAGEERRRRREERRREPSRQPPDEETPEGRDGRAGGNGAAEEPTARGMRPTTDEAERAGRPPLRGTRARHGGRRGTLHGSHGPRPLPQAAAVA